jgi:hypothetical protein
MINSTKYIEQDNKLKRYFLNADPFLWGILAEKNKKKRLKELKQMGFLAKYSEGSNPIYTKINQDLLVELGIKGILEQIVIPRIRKGFKVEILRYFRDCWEQGRTPEVDYLMRNKLYRRQAFTSIVSSEVREGWAVDAPIVGYRDAAFIFVRITREFNVIEGWTVFAGLWFEEIEPLLS